MKSNYQILLENLFEGVYYVDRERKVKYWSKGAEIITGYLSSEVMGKSCSNFLSHTSLDGNPLCKSGCMMRNALATGSFFKTEAFLRHKDGHKVQVSIRITPMYNKAGQVVGATQIFTNNEAFFTTNSEEAQKHHKTLYDVDTQLPNQHNLRMVMQAKIEEFNRYEWPFSTYLMEIDNFERIKSSYEIKNQKYIIARISSILHNGVRPFDILGRWSNSTFLAILVNVDAEGIEKLGKRLLNHINESTIQIGLGELKVSLSIGASVVQQEDTPDNLLNRLEHALSHSKNTGGNKLTIES